MVPPDQDPGRGLKRRVAKWISEKSRKFGEVATRRRDRRLFLSLRGHLWDEYAGAEEGAKAAAARVAASLAELRQKTVGLKQKTSEVVRQLKSEKLSKLALGSLKVEFHKVCWRAVSTVTRRTLVSVVFPGSVCYYDIKVHPGVEGRIALTVDDAPCSRSDQRLAMIREVRELLREFDAKATFFVCSDYVEGHEAEMRELLADGHEVANHCPADRSYAEDSEEAFETALLQAEAVCEHLRRQIECMDAVEQSVRWFRAPHGRLSEPMQRVLRRHGFTNVLCDCYANDPWISDAKFVAKNMLESANDGSIAVIHMPERGFREYNQQALRDFLTGLRARRMQVVTLSTLHGEAVRPPIRACKTGPLVE